VTPFSYRSPKTEVRESKIHGRGLFAKADIAKGEIVAVKGGHIVDRETLRREITPALGPVEIQIGDDLFIAPVTDDEGELSMLYTNHSCEPNIGLRGEITFVALRAISAGEELTHDWAMTDDDDYSVECNCGANSCRKTLTGKDWQRQELQKKYAGYFSAYLAKKIAGENGCTFSPFNRVEDRQSDWIRHLLISLILTAGISASFPLRGADERKMTVVDYYLRLPDKTFEGSAADWLRFLKQPKCGVVDLANGYMSCIGDGAQPPFEVALFRYRDGRPLLALCQGELEGEKSLFLDFFEMRSEGKMHKTRRSIFPAADAGADQANWHFELPRQGRTVLLRHQRSGKVLYKFTWNGEKFVEQRDAASN
jgi:hypothetical protein